MCKYSTYTIYNHFVTTNTISVHECVKNRATEITFFNCFLKFKKNKYLSRKNYKNENIFKNSANLFKCF